MLSSNNLKVKDREINYKHNLSKYDNIAIYLATLVEYCLAQ